MSRPENRRSFFIANESTKIEVTTDEIRLTQGGGVFVFNSVEDYMAFVNRIGILTVKLDQELNPPEEDNGTSHNDNEPPA